MVDAKVEVEVEADGVAAGGDLGGFGLVAVAPGSLVAAEVGRVDPVVVVGHEAEVVLADVFKGAGADAVEHQVREEEVGGGEGGEHSEGAGGEGGEVHLEDGEEVDWLLGSQLLMRMGMRRVLVPSYSRHEPSTGVI